MDFWRGSNIYRYIYPLIFLLPLNVFIIGNNLGQGIQWALFRYQDTYLGPSLIPIWRNADYVLNGTITGKSAIAETLIIIAAIGFILAFLLLLTRYPRAVKVSGIITLANGILLLVSSLVQYGIVLHGPAGESIPVGIPVLLVLGACMMLDDAPPQKKREILLTVKRYDSLLFFVGCLIIYSLHTTIISFSNDTIPNQLLPYYILHDHTLYLDQATTYINDYGYGFRFIELTDGHFVSLFPIVTPVLALPLYIIPIAILNIPMTDYSLLLMGKVSAAFFSALACAFIFLTCKKIASYRIALVSALIFAFATSTWSVSSQSLWPHCVGEFLLAAGLYLVVRNEEKESIIPVAGLGIVSGLFVFNRPSDAILVLPFVYYVLRFCSRKFSAFFIAAVLSGLPFLLYNLYFFSSPLGGYTPIASRLAPGTTTLFNYLGLLVAPNKGLLVFSPVLILALIGFYFVYKKRENALNAVVLSSIVAILITLAVYALFDDWIGGVVYGPRYLTSILPFLAVAVCLALRYLFDPDSPDDRMKLLVTAGITFLVCISVIIQIIGVIFFPIAYNSDLISPENLDPWNGSRLIIIDSFVYGSTSSSSLYLEPVTSGQLSGHENITAVEPGKIILAEQKLHR